MLYLLAGCDEQCTSDKKKIHIICPHIWIHYVISGQGFYNENKLGAGDAFIVYKGDECTYRPEPHDPWRYVWIRLHGEDSEKLIKRCGLPMESGVFKFSYSEQLTTIISALVPSYDMPTENKPYAEAAAKALLSLHYSSDVEEHASVRERYVEQAAEYINANYHKPIRVEAIADMLHIDRKYLRNLFVEYKGMSTRDYMLNIRFQRAKELLASTNKSIGIIAASVGYEDILAFSKLFKKHTGMSPKEYRKMRLQ